MFYAVWLIVGLISAYFLRSKKVIVPIGICVLIMICHFLFGKYVFVEQDRGLCLQAANMFANGLLFSLVLLFLTEFAIQIASMDGRVTLLQLYTKGVFLTLILFAVVVALIDEKTTRLECLQIFVPLLTGQIVEIAHEKLKQWEKNI